MCGAVGSGSCMEEGQGDGGDDDDEAESEPVPSFTEALRAFERRFPSQRKLQPSGRVRPSLEVITEEASYQHTRRRKQLIPRARLIHRKRTEEPARRSSSLNLQFISRTRPFLLTPPPDFRATSGAVGTDRTRQPARDQSGNAQVQSTASLPGGTSALRRIGKSGSITNTAHRPPRILAFSTLNGIENSAVNTHQICHSTDKPSEIPPVYKTQGRFQDSGNETTKLTQLSVNADTKRIKDCTGETSTEISVQRAAESAGDSCVTTAGESANTAKHSQAYSRQSASIRADSKDPPVHSPNIFQLCTRENTHDEPTPRPLKGQGTRAQDCAGFSGKGPDKTQRPDGETRRKWEDVNETRDKREYKTRTHVREADPADERETKVDCTACRTRGRADSIEEKYTSGQDSNSRPDIKDKTENKEQAENPASVKNKGIQRSPKGKLTRTDGISIEKGKTCGLTEYSAGNKGKARRGSAEHVAGNFATADEEQDTEARDSATAGKPERRRQDSSDAMSRRPQVLKITDSATTAFRRRDGNKHDEIQHDSIGLRQESHAKSSPLASEDGTPKTTRNLKSIFDGGREMVSSPRQIRKEDKTAGTLPAPGVTCEAAAGKTKPMLIATLSMEEAGDTLQKLSIRNENNSSPDPQTSTAFRAFSCNGHETLSTVTKSVPDYVEATQHKTLHAGLLKERDSKAAAFDGLLQYLQDYRHGLRELLVNNNVVIIEPVRQSRVRLENQKYSATKSASEGTCRITGATVKKGNSTSAASNTLPRQQPILRRHFFYHPIRTNRSLVDEELPDPEKVRHAREIFERSIKMKDSHHEQTSSANDTISTRNNRSSPAKVISASRTDSRNAADKVKRKYLTVDTVFRHNALHKRWTDSGSLSSGISSDLSCYETDVESKEEQTDVFSSDDENPDRNYYLEESDEGHYVAPEVLERIRACGTTVTYYGGRVIAASNGPLRSPMTLAIMDEIQKNQKFTRKGTRIIPDEYLGVKFRLVKSNSCGSRLELAGTEEDEKSNSCGSRLELAGTEDEKWNAIAEEEHDAPRAQKSGDRTANMDKGNEQGHAEGAKSSRTGCLDSVLSTEIEGRSTHGQTDMCEGCIRGAPTKIWFSPEKAEDVERGSRNVLFNDIEFEEFEIAEDSLDVIQENDIECSKTDEDYAEQMHPRNCRPVSNHNNVIEKQSNEARSSTSKANGVVQMTTWASRSVLFDFRNCEAEDSHLPTRKTGPNHSTC